MTPPSKGMAIRACPMVLSPAEEGAAYVALGAALENTTLTVPVPKSVRLLTFLSFLIAYVPDMLMLAQALAGHILPPPDVASTISFTLSVLIYTTVHVSPEPTVTVTPLFTVIGPALIAFLPLVMV